MSQTKRMFRPGRWAWLTVLAAVCLASAAPAVADRARARVETEAARVGVAATPAQAVQDQQTLKPAVDAAIAAGEGPGLLASHNPTVLADLLPYARQGATADNIYPKPSASAARLRGPRARTAGCYGDPWNQLNWTEFGATVAWIYDRVNGWCGTWCWGSIGCRGVIYWAPGATFASWSWGPFCLGGKGTDWSWDAWPGWIHTAHWASLGASYPWGCFTYSGGKVVIKIAWNGWWDESNDYGF